MFVSVRDCMLVCVNAADPFAAMKELGVASVEIEMGRDLGTPGFLESGKTPYNLSDAAGRGRLQDQLSENGAGISAFMMANDFSRSDLENEKLWLEDTCRIAREMGVEAVRIDLIPGSESMDEGVFVDRCAEAIKQAFSSVPGVQLGIENHGARSNTREFLDAVIGKVGSERLGLTLDTGNFYWWGHALDTVYELMERFAPRVKHTHVKNINFPQDKRNVPREMGWEYAKYVSPIYEGDIDHARVVKILKGAGYDGDLCVEDESMGKFTKAEQAEVLKKDTRYLQSLLTQ